MVVYTISRRKGGVLTFPTEAGATHGQRHQIFGGGIMVSRSRLFPIAWEPLSWNATEFKHILGFEATSVTALRGSWAVNEDCSRVRLLFGRLLRHENSCSLLEFEYC